MFLQCLVICINLVISITTSQHPLCLLFKLLARDPTYSASHPGLAPVRRGRDPSHNQYDVKYDRDVRQRLRIGQHSQLEWLMTTMPTGRSPWISKAIEVIGPCPAHMTGLL